MKKIIIFVMILAIFLISCGGENAGRETTGKDKFRDSITCYSPSGEIVYHYDNAYYEYKAEGYLKFSLPEGGYVLTNLMCSVEINGWRPLE